MGDFKYNKASSVSSISTETYVINTTPPSAFYSSAATDVGGGSSGSASNMQDDCLAEQAGGVKPQGMVATGGVDAPEDPQHQQHNTNDEDPKAGVNGESSVPGVGGAAPGTGPGPLGSGTTPGNSVFVPPGSGGVPTAAAAAAAAVAAAAAASGGGGSGSGVVGGPGGGGGLVEPTQLPNSLTSSVASLWPPSSVDDALMHSGMPTINGSLAFHGLGPSNPGGPGAGGPSPLFSTSLGPQLGLGPTAPQNPQQRRNMQQPAPNFPGQARPQSLGSAPGPQGPFLPNKYPSSWSSGLGSQGSAWSPGPSPQGNSAGGPGGGPGNGSGVPPLPWSARGRGGMGSMGGISPLGHNLGSMSSHVSVPRKNSNLPNTQSMVMNKFRRSTSYPGKGPFPNPPSFEITGVDDSGFPRDLLQFPVSLDIVLFF